MKDFLGGRLSWLNLGSKLIVLLLGGKNHFLKRLTVRQTFISGGAAKNLEGNKLTATSRPAEGLEKDHKWGAKENRMTHERGD